MFNGDILVGKGKIMSKLFWKILFWSICHPLVLRPSMTKATSAAFLFVIKLFIPRQQDMMS